MSGVRILCDKDIPVDSWDYEFVVVGSKLVSEISSQCLVDFDLLNPLDNSGNGWTVTKGGGIIKPYGLGFTRSGGGAQTDFASNSDAISLLCAVRPNSTTAFSTFIDCRTLTVGSGSGFRVVYDQSQNKIRVQIVYPSAAVAYYTFQTFVSGEWDIICITISSSSLRIENQRGEVLQVDFSSTINLTKWAVPMILGQDVSGGTCDGGVGFVAVYSGAMTPAQRKAAITVGSEIMASRA